ncbi:hypothetical protein HQN90_37570 [Paenibacillus alba]|nr:hypothetical protein [Paenibacillus alba]
MKKVKTGKLALPFFVFGRDVLTVAKGLVKRVNGRVKRAFQEVKAVFRP